MDNRVGMESSWLLHGGRCCCRGLGGQEVSCWLWVVLVRRGLSDDMFFFLKAFIAGALSGAKGVKRLRTRIGSPRRAYITGQQMCKGRYTTSHGTLCADKLFVHPGMRPV